MNRLLAITLINVALFFQSQVHAHTDAHLDTVNAPHGGQLRMAGPYHLELVVKDREIALYVMDHANGKINADGGVSKAIVQTDKVKTSVKLEPFGENVLKGTAEFLARPETTVTVFITLPKQEAQTARFKPFAPKNKEIKIKEGAGEAPAPQTVDHNKHHH